MILYTIKETWFYDYNQLLKERTPSPHAHTPIPPKVSMMGYTKEEGVIRIRKRKYIPTHSGGKV